MKLNEFALIGNFSELEDKIVLISAGAAAGLAVSKNTSVNAKKAMIIGAGVCLLANIVAKNYEK